MDALNIHGLGLERGGHRVLEGLDCCAADTGITAVIGPSGCGKTSLLRCIAGFERLSFGTIEVGGRLVAGPSVHLAPEQRRVGMVFQDGALFPHLDAAANVGYGLGVRPDPSRVREMLELVGLVHLAARRPDQLSGGEQQRLALARALAPRPDLLLLDEPFANLDAGLRRHLREELFEVVRTTATAALLVTHDQEEALSLADRVGILLDGRIQHLGAPEEVYTTPKTAAVARFLGEGQLVRCEVAGGRVTTRFGTARAAGPGTTLALIRPENLRLVEAANPEHTGILERSRFFGHDALDQVRFDDGSTAEVRRLAGSPSWPLGSAVGVELATEELWTLDN
jgi:iron(III) transport system ATP-binding protein